MGIDTPRGSISNMSWMALCEYLDSRPDRERFLPLFNAGWEDEPDEHEVEAILLHLGTLDVPDWVGRLLDSLGYRRGQGPAKAAF